MPLVQGHLHVREPSRTLADAAVLRNIRDVHLCLCVMCSFGLSRCSDRHLRIREPSRTATNAAVLRTVRDVHLFMCLCIGMGCQDVLISWELASPEALVCLEAMQKQWRMACRSLGMLGCSSSCILECVHMRVVLDKSSGVGVGRLGVLTKCVQLFCFAEKHSHDIHTCTAYRVRACIGATRHMVEVCDSAGVGLGHVRLDGMGGCLGCDPAGVKLVGNVYDEWA